VLAQAQVWLVHIMAGFSLAALNAPLELLHHAAAYEERQVTTKKKMKK
jgi:hypothetical protein